MKQKDNKGWFLFVDASLVAEQYRELFDTYQHVRQVAAVETADVLFKHACPRAAIGRRTGCAQQVRVVVPGRCYSRNDRFDDSAAENGGPVINRQRYHLTNRFKQLARHNYKDSKQVQQYAELLNITPLYQ